MERSKLGEFNWVDLSSRDFDGQSAFYEGLFGWSHTDVVPSAAELAARGIPSAEGMTYRMFNSDGHTVGGMSQLSADMIAQGQPSAWNTYVATDDVDATAAKAADLGGTVDMPPMDVTGFGRMAGIQDPTGAYIFLWKPLRSDETIEYLQPGMFSWADLTTRDPEKAVAFYTNLLGWDVQPMDAGSTPYWQVSVDGQGEGRHHADAGDDSRGGPGVLDAVLRHDRHRREFREGHGARCDRSAGADGGHRHAVVRGACRPRWRHVCPATAHADTRDVARERMPLAL